MVNNLVFSSTGRSHTVVTSKICHYHPPAGIISRTRVVVYEDGNFCFQVLLQSKETGKLERLCNMMIDKKWKFCPGLDPDEYYTFYFPKIRYHIKNVRCSDNPFRVVSSINCTLWHKLARNASIMEKSMESVPCSSCKRLRYVVEDLAQSCMHFHLGEDISG